MPLSLKKLNFMNEEKPKLITRGGIIFDLIISVIFFIGMLPIISEHVPDDRPLWVNIFGTYTTFGLTLVFWMVLQFLRVTWKDQRLRKKAVAQIQK